MGAYGDQVQPRDLEPEQGPPETLVLRLRRYLEPFDPECARNWRGSNEETIAEYTRLCDLRADRALPLSYLTYLRALGDANGDLFGEFKLVTEVPRLIELYQGASELEPLSGDLPVCGSYVVSDQISLDLRGEGEPSVAETTNGTWYSELSKSWEALVMQAAIKRVEARRLPLRRWFSRSSEGLEAALGPDDTVEKLRSVLESFAEPRGMHRAWASDSRHHVLIGERHCLYATVHEPPSMLVTCFTSDQPFLDDVQSQLEPALGVGLGGRAGLVNGRLTDVKT